MSTCGFLLTKTKGNTMSSHHDEKLDIKISDNINGVSSDCFHLIVQRADAGLLHPSLTSKLDFCIVANLTTSTTNARGDITQTSFDIYGRGRRRGLMVREWKQKRKGEKPYMGTVAHYYANAKNGEDVGLSVVVKRIRVSDNGHFDFAVDGPEQHPVHALFYMFDEVLRTRTWKPTHCPHCAKKHHPSYQSESEDSDKDFAALLHGRKQDARGNVANNGVFKGNNNGNLIINIPPPKDGLSVGRMLRWLLEL